MKKNVIVTGSAGFIGSHLAKWHLDKGDNVIGVDNFSSSSGNLYKPSKHHSDLMMHLGFKFIAGDINDEMVVKLLLREECDILYNFACPASPPRYQAMPVQTMLTCTNGVYNMLEVARRKRAIFVQASTSEVYGDPNVEVQDEKYWGNVNSYGPRSCYDEGKRAAEALCYDYLNKHGVDARLVRIFNTYGPNMDPNDGRVISNFINQAISGKKLTIYGDGSQTRSFCYVSDLVDAVTKLALLEKNPATPVNVGNPVEFTMLEAAKQVLVELGMLKNWNQDHSEFITYNPLPVDDPKRRKPNIELATNLLGWKPTVSLKVGLKNTIEYYKSLKDSK